MNPFKQFLEMRKILCITPCCETLVRVSDLHLTAKGKVAPTWLDTFDKKQLAFGRKEDLFEEQEGKLREIAVEKGRKQAQIVINKAISPAFRALKINPYDVKPLLNPVDFLVFKGMEEYKKVSEVTFLSHKYKNKEINITHQQISRVVKAKEYDWQVARIDETGKIEFE